MCPQGRPRGQGRPQGLHLWLLDCLYVAYNLFCVVIAFNIPFVSDGFFCLLSCTIL